MDEDMYSTGDETPDIAEGKAPSALNDAALYSTLRQWFLLDDAHSKEWRNQAKEDFDFVAGDQWPEKDTKVMQGERRQPLTFNYTGPFIRAVVGLEIGTRHETVYIPRETEEGEIAVNETISGTSKWMGDNCNAEDEQSAAFKDTLVCGMGWCEASMSYEEDDKDGKYMEQQLDAAEMRWDRSARKKNLLDARRVWRVRSMTLDEAREMFPDALDGDLDCSWASGYDVGEAPKTIEERRLKLENSVPLDPASEVHIIQVQWIERECYYRVAFAEGEEELTEEKFKEFSGLAKQAGKKLDGVKQYRKVRRQAFLGGKVLGKGPCPDPQRFTFQCITGMLHKSKGTWYGLVRLMRDPNMNLNKWLSQALHILNSTAKGGIIAERGVFKNITEAQKTYANPQAITIVEDKSISGGRIMQKPGAGLAAPYVQLTDLATKAIPAVTGINLELLGMVDRNQPGILEAQRKQAGMTILADLFDSLRLYRKENGHIRLHFIQNYIPDNKIIRVVGPTGAKAIRFLRDKHLGDCDVVVSDAPTTTNQKELTWQLLMQMSQVPTFAQLLQDPEVAAECLDYCPLPTKVVHMLKQSITQPKPDMEQQKQLAIADALAKIKEAHAKANKTEAEVGKVAADTKLSDARAILALADAGVKHNQALRDQAMAQFHQVARPTGMPARMPQMPMEEEFAAQDQSSLLPMPPPVPVSSRRLPMGFEGIEDLIAEDVPPQA